MINQTIHGYTIRHLIGSGGMADVYYAENSLCFPAAIKVLKPEYNQNAGIKERFVNEAKIMKQLNHPHIRKVMDLGEQEGRAFIIMEYLEGRSFKEVIYDRKSISDASLMKYFDQCAQALIYTHGMQVTHRDIKPGNIFVTNQDEVKLVDFGIARSGLSLNQTVTGQTLGTVMYMSPEQVQDPRRVTGKSDIYSLGVTFYHALAGSPPYDMDTGSEFAVMRKIVDETLDISQVPPHWRNILAGCLRKNPVERPELKARNFQEDITLVDGPALPPPPPGKAVLDIPKPPTTNSIWIYVLASAFILIAAVVIATINKGNDGTDKSSELVVFEENGRYGYKDAADRIIIPARYETASPFIEGKAKVSDGTFEFFINRSGIPLDTISRINETNDLNKYIFNLKQELMNFSAFEEGWEELHHRKIEKIESISIPFINNGKTDYLIIFEIQPKLLFDASHYDAHIGYNKIVWVSNNLGSFKVVDELENFPDPGYLRVKKDFFTTDLDNNGVDEVHIQSESFTITPNQEKYVYYLEFENDAINIRWQSGGFTYAELIDDKTYAFYNRDWDLNKGRFYPCKWEVRIFKYNRGEFVQMDSFKTRKDFDAVDPDLKEIYNSYLQNKTNRG